MSRRRSLLSHNGKIIAEWGTTSLSISLFLSISLTHTPKQPLPTIFVRGGMTGAIDIISYTFHAIICKRQTGFTKYELVYSLLRFLWARWYNYEYNYSDYTSFCTTSKRSCLLQFKQNSFGVFSLGTFFKDNEFYIHILMSITTY